MIEWLAELIAELAPHQVKPVAVKVLRLVKELVPSMDLNANQQATITDALDAAITGLGTSASN